MQRSVVNIMRKLIFFLFCILLYLKGFSTSYYFENEVGDDSYTPTQAQNKGTPWKTINRLNTFFAGTIPGFPGVKPVAGDSLLLHRGNTFVTTAGIIIGVSGVIISSYFDVGDAVNLPKAEITGFKTLTFTTHVGNVWTSNESISVDPLNLVTLNGNVIGMGRYPQSGWFNVDSRTAGTTPTVITSTHNWGGTSGGLLGQPTWNLSTAQAVFRLAMWVNGRYSMTAQGTNTISVTNTHESVDAIQTGWGFFIQDDPATLLYSTAWYFNRSTNKVQYYHSSTTVAPQGLKAANVNRLVLCNGFSNTTLLNLSFTGANDTCINIVTGSRVNVQNCVLNGQMIGIATTADNSHYNGDSIINSLNTAISLSSSATTDTANSNYIYNTSVIVGSGGYVGAVRDDDGCAILMNENGADVEQNVIRNTGVSGTRTYRVNNIYIKYNWVDSFNLNRSDLGGIYFVSNNTTSNNTNRYVIHNTVSNGFGPRAGTNKTKGNDVCIYFDNGAYGVNCDSNNVSNATVGIFIHSSSNINVRWNTAFNVDTCLQINHESSSNRIPQNCIIKNNIWYLNSSEGSQRTLMVKDYAIASQINAIGIIDSNYYLRPIGTNNAIFDFGSVNRTLPSWQAAYATVSYDVHSSIGSYTYQNTTNQGDSVRFEYNTTSINKIVSLPGTYKDIRNVSYSGSITLLPFTSAVLFLITGGVIPPNNNLNFNIRGHKVYPR